MSKSKSPLCREDFFDPACKDNILGRNQTRQEWWREHLEDPTEALDKALKYLEKSVSNLIVGSRLFVKLAVNGLWPRGLRHGRKKSVQPDKAGRYDGVEVDPETGKGKPSGGKGTGAVSLAPGLDAWLLHEDDSDQDAY